ncbi:Hydroxymethylpyrimidine/phosphomethylpyrimidine kinase [Delftia tsuruhatensis]|uniref:bifunctional hydroxymethylpyrimidine kinase/phosphomethylpyrimidine kinase n=1 Tax=Delftia tsuruhatensis TaxID=180282 RepID=UPI001E79F296|nr:bifunctional hydroxymethylpyrimidine kinase/phosphomethylpyrimidine kinase [Delftia tsuruhatensis]CAB5702402.1 Hydroxymethylpyrimidine/phosphomethylpyrimidine kinase [Delftia tsuruhatensis]CAC9691223.1 Hydroxymethylpyrimidine/phosphomethylpyrimidine kinase [Delftia tsuruhatensis]
MALNPSNSPSPDTDPMDEAAPVCVLVFNASDPSGAGGLSADIATIASVGGHPLPVVTGAYARDSAKVFEHFPFDDEAVAEQARAVLEDIPVSAIKVGFVGSPGNLAAIAEIASDYPDIPIVSYMPDLSWWEEDPLDQYLDAFKELVLPQTSVLVGSHSTLWRWLLPDWSGSRSPTARDIAMAAEALEVPYVLVTGMPLPDQFVDNVLATAQSVLGNSKYELFDATFTGSGDTLSAALTALVASGNDLGLATQEALEYLDRSLDSGFRPGMGHFIPDRMFWAQPESDDEDAEAAAEPPATLESDPQAIEGFVMPPHDTKH